MKEIVIVGMSRTPIGSFQGALSSLTAPQLGAHAIKNALERSGLKGEQVTEVLMGCVLPAGQGQAPARQAMIGAGLPKSTTAVTVNKVCGSGMKTVIQAMQALKLGDAEVMIAGGMESMTNAPYLLPGGRGGYRMGNGQVLDSMIVDGLWDPYKNQHMGNCGELCAREYKFSREEQDQFAIESFKRAQAAQASGKFKSEIAPITIAGKKGDTVIENDEGPSKVMFDKVPTLKPVFDKAGTITAANASTINDGAAALVLTSADFARAHGLKPIARLVSYAGHAQDPDWFTTAPIPAMQKALKAANWDLASVDLFEINEAFAVVPMAAARDLKIAHSKLNVWGGGISLGHPIGASGARIIVTLTHALKDAGLKRGMAGICIGGGEGLAVCVEMI